MFAHGSHNNDLELHRCDRDVGLLWITLQPTPLTQQSGRLGAEGGELLVDDDEALLGELQTIVRLELDDVATDPVPATVLAAGYSAAGSRTRRHRR